jgi:multiple sugar transport system substrate-binding protein
MNRLFSLFVVFLTAFGFTACTAAPPAAPTVDSGAAPTTVTDTGEPTPETGGAEPVERVELNIAVTMNAQAMENFERGLEAIRAAHPEWTINVELVPQEGRIERITTAIASQTLPDLVLVDGLTIQQWIRQGAFADLSPFVSEDGLDMGAFYPGPVDQFSFDGKPYGIPYDAAPEVVYYNKGMFDAAGVDYPTDDWTYDQMREVAPLLTLDAEGRNATDPDFDATQIVQWGWNSTPNHIWGRHFIQARGADYCVNEDCTVTDFTAPEVVEAFRWWAEMAQEEHSAPYDVYTGAQTGVPGDPFIAGKAAMGFNNIAFAPGVNEQSEIEYDVVQPFVGVDGNRYGPISTQAWVMSATSENQDAAWDLLRELTTEEFLTEYVATPGHGIPALRAAAPAAINPGNDPANQQAAIDAMEYEDVFRPFTASAFETYAKTNSLFIEAMKGDRPLEEILAEIETAANETLAKDIVE